MDDLINMMVSDESPADISDKIKEILMQKSAQNIETIRPIVAASIVNGESSEEGEDETSAEESSETEEEPTKEDAE